ncbi:MAG: amino acid/amide transporter substrate-binding protein family [Rhodospirillales bacterium]|jgi:branched-chain amino acid transport system substrate-binding protein|nr:amino acid/amide transporter substrate-binding protein family [Rhodospirillales bacterium]
MTIRRRSLLASASLIAAPALALAQGRGDPLRVGAFGPFSGSAAAFGQSMREAIELVTEARNRAGGIRGQRIEVVFADDGGRPEEATTIARRFATRDRVLLAFGSVSSPASLSASQVFREEEVAQIAITATSQRLTRLGNEWIFRSTVPDRKQVADLVDFLAERHPQAKRFATISVNDDFGRGGVEAFNELGRAKGLSSVAEERYARGDIDFTAQLTRLRGANPDAILDWSRYTEGALIVRQLRQMQSNLPIFGSDGYAVPAYVELAGPAAEGVTYVTPFSIATATRNPVAQRLTAELLAAHNKAPDGTHALAYDAANAAYAAIEKAGRADRRAIRDALRQTDMDSTRGRLRFDETGDPTLLSPVVQIRSGREADARA